MGTRLCAWGAPDAMTPLLPAFLNPPQAQLTAEIPVSRPVSPSLLRCVSHPRAANPTTQLGLEPGLSLRPT